MTTRDFDAMLAEKAGIRPTFKVAGQEFTLRAKLPYAKWQKLLAAMRSDDVSPHEANVEFFRTALIRADRERFLSLLNVEDDEDDDADDSAVIGMDQIDGIIDWAMEHFTGKLRSSSSGSSPGADETGPQRNVVSLNARSTAI